MGSTGLEVLGRLDGALNSGGATVFPEQIETALGCLPGLEALLVVGLPDPEWGQRLIGLVKPAPGTNGNALLERLRQLSLWPAPSATAQAVADLPGAGHQPRGQVATKALAGLVAIQSIWVTTRPESTR